MLIPWTKMTVSMTDSAYANGILTPCLFRHPSRLRITPRYFPDEVLGGFSEGRRDGLFETQKPQLILGAGSRRSIPTLEPGAGKFAGTPIQARQGKLRYLCSRWKRRCSEGRGVARVGPGRPGSHLPGLPQIRTCPIKGSGSSRRGLTCPALPVVVSWAADRGPMPPRCC